MTTTTLTTPTKIPGPRPLSTVGDYVRYARFFIDPIRTMRKQYATYGDISGATRELQIGERGDVFVFGAEYNQQVLSDPALFYSPDLGAPPNTALARLSSGLVFENADRHRQHRRLVMPAFHKKHIESYHDDMVSYTQQMLDSWHIGEQRDIAREMHALTMHIANKTLFGLTKLEENIGELIARWLAYTVSPVVRMLPIDFPGAPRRRFIKASEELEAKIRAIIARKRANLDEHHDVLATLLKTRDEDGAFLTDDEVVGQTNILFIAGHETSANTLVWALFMLSQHPQVLAQVLDELDSTLHGQIPTVEQIGSLPIMERALKETLRMLPPLIWTLRTAQQPVQIGAYQLPAGSNVMYSHFITHRIAPVFEQPDKFLPERWLTINPAPYEYIPFSGGPRLCVGATFAMMEMKIVLSMLLQRFNLTPVAGAKIDYRALPTLTPKNGLPMNVNAPTREPQKVAVTGDVHELVDLG